MKDSIPGSAMTRSGYKSVSTWQANSSTEIDQKCGYPDSVVSAAQHRTQQSDRQSALQTSPGGLYHADVLSRQQSTSWSTGMRFLEGAKVFRYKNK